MNPTTMPTFGIILSAVLGACGAVVWYLWRRMQTQRDQDTQGLRNQINSLSNQLERFQDKVNAKLEIVIEDISEIEINTDITSNHVQNMSNDLKDMVQEYKGFNKEVMLAIRDLNEKAAVNANELQHTKNDISKLETNFGKIIRKD